MIRTTAASEVVLCRVRFSLSFSLCVCVFGTESIVFFGPLLRVRVPWTPVSGPRCAHLSRYGAVGLARRYRRACGHAQVPMLDEIMCRILGFRCLLALNSGVAVYLIMFVCRFSSEGCLFLFLRGALCAWLVSRVGRHHHTCQSSPCMHTWKHTNKHTNKYEIKPLLPNA